MDLLKLNFNKTIECLKNHFHRNEKFTQKIQG